MNIKNLSNKRTHNKNNLHSKVRAWKLTTKAIRKSFVNHIFEVPTATQRLIDNGLPPDHINDYFNLAFSGMKETKLIMFQYKILHDIVFTKEKLFRANIANSDLCYLCLETKQDLKHRLMSIRLRVLESFPVLVRVSRFNRARTINHQYLVWYYW